MLDDALGRFVLQIKWTRLQITQLLRQGVPAVSLTLRITDRWQFTISMG